MEIKTEIVIDDRSNCDDKDNYMTVPQLRQTINVARRIHGLRPTVNNNKTPNTIRTSDV